MFAAAKRDRPDVLAFLLDLGYPLESQDRTGKRTLHEAAVNNAFAAAAFLIERGPRWTLASRLTTRHRSAGPAHGDRTAMVTWLSRHSRDLWALCFNGCVDRVAGLLKEEPDLARAVTRDGHTPLWWLPDDDQQAIRSSNCSWQPGPIRR